MNLALCSLASGSSGNCYVIMSDTTTILADAGISGKRIFAGLEVLGRTHIDGVTISHEHSDHIQGIAALLKKETTIYSNEKTLDAIGLGAERSVQITTGTDFCIGDITVHSFPLSHDAADPSGFCFEKNGKAVTIMTDTGYVTEDCYRYMAKADILVLESNHDESMLRIGRYPWFLKQRILGKEGHLSNDAAAEGLVQVLKLEALSGKTRERTVLLAHLSKENNFPEMALATMSNTLEAEGFYTGKSLHITTLAREEMSEVFTL